MNSTSSDLWLDLNSALLPRIERMLVRFVLNKTQAANSVMTVRSKDDSQGRSGVLKQTSFAFRRIQARELYQPSQDAEPGNRPRFRIRVQLLGRAQ